MKRIVQQYAQSKFENLSLIDFRPEVLSAYKRCIETGQLDQVDELYKAMYHEWDALQKDVNKVTSALGTLDFRAVPYAADGAAPTPEAEAVAALVNAALWHAPQPGTGEWQHGFAQLPGAIYHALLRGYNVHEIIWAYDGGMYYPAAYLPVMPQFFAWECRSGEPDRLLLYPRGVGFSDARAFPRHKFIVALNNQGVDHPMENSILRALVPWFCAAVWGPRWLMQYCQIFGLPIRTFRAGSAEERADLEIKLAEQPVVTDVVLLDGEEMTVQSPGSSTGLPQRELIELAEKACHKLILGQTLTSDTSDGGSRAQAQVHSEVLKDDLMSIGEYVCGVLNAQLVPAIVRMNYGGTQVPMPELRCSLPNAAATRETVELLDGMINRLGMSIRRSDVYDKLGIAMPDPGDDVLGPAMAPAPGRDAISAAAAARYPEAGGSTATALADAAEQAAESVCRAWSAPVREALAKAAAEGKSPQEMLELLESLRCDTALLAEAQESIMRAGLGLSDEEVAASRKQSICRAKDPSKCRVHGKGVSREGEGKAPRKPYQDKTGLQGRKKNEPDEQERRENEIMARPATPSIRPYRAHEPNYAPARIRTGSENEAIRRTKQALGVMRQENKVIGRLGSYEVILNARSDEMLSLKALDKSNVNGVSDDVHLRAVENLRSIWPSHHLSEGAQKSNRLSEKGLVEYLKPSGYYTDKETGKSYKVRFTIKRIKNEDALRLYSIELAPLKRK